MGIFRTKKSPEELAEQLSIKGRKPKHRDADTESTTSNDTDISTDIQEKHNQQDSSNQHNSEQYNKGTTINLSKHTNLDNKQPTSSSYDWDNTEISDKENKEKKKLLRKSSKQNKKELKLNKIKDDVTHTQLNTQQKNVAPRKNLNKLLQNYNLPTDTTESIKPGESIKPKTQSASIGSSSYESTLQYEDLTNTRPISVKRRVNSGSLKEEIKRTPKRDIKRGNFIEILVEDALNKLTKGELEVQESSFELSYNKILATNFVKQVVQIIELPQDGVYAGYLEQLRDDLKESFPPEQQQMFDVVLLQYLSDNHQNLSSRKLKGLEASLIKQLKAYEYDRQVAEDPMKGFSSSMQEMAQQDRLTRSSIESQKASREEIMMIETRIQRVVRKLTTFEEVQKFQLQGGHCLDCYMFIEVYARDIELLAVVMDRLREMLSGRKFSYREILDLSNYLKTFGVASLTPLTKKSKFDVLPFLTTSNIPLLSNSFKSGIVRSKNPEIYMGNQVGNNYRFDISVTDSGSAENYLMIAKSGAGKSGFLAIAALTTMDNPYISIIIKDYKGKEWTPFAKLFPTCATVVSMDTDNSVFVNTYKIPDYKLYGFENPSSAFMLSLGITIKILMALVDPIEDEIKLVQDICTDICNRVYLTKGVAIDKHSTYENSHGIDFKRDTWQAITEMCNDNDMRIRYSDEKLSLVKRALEPYFGYKGTKAGFFAREIDLNTLLFNNRIIVFDYGAQSVGGAYGQTSNEIRTRVFQESYCETLFTALQKRAGKYTLIITEEIQRLMSDKLMMQTLNHQFTGGRSANIINIGITNTVGSLIHNNEPDIVAIKENITGYIIGNCDASVVRDLVEYTNLKDIQYTLDTISRGKGNYKHAFLVHNLLGKFDTVVTKMPVTQEMLNTLLDSKTILDRPDEYSY